MGHVSSCFSKEFRELHGMNCGVEYDLTPPAIGQATRDAKRGGRLALGPRGRGFGL